MKFYIEAKFFETELGGVWRGRAMDANSTRQLNFMLPLPASATTTRAEVSTVYELARSLPTFVGPDTAVTIILTSEEVKEQILNHEDIINLFGDIDLTIETASANSTP